MKRLFKQLLLVFSISLVIAPCSPTHSCIDFPDVEQYRPVFFNPALGDPSGDLEPFFYSQHYYFAAPWYSSEPDNSEDADQLRNCTEWRRYLGNNVAETDVLAVINADANGYLTAQKEGNLARLYAGNTFIQALLQPEHRAALDYFTFAKRFEFGQMEALRDPWEDHYTASSDTNFTRKMALQAQAKVEGPLHLFLKQRWAYQCINTGYYDRQSSRDTLGNIFESCLADSRSGTVLTDWALLKWSEMNPDSLEGNLGYAHVFDRCPSRRKRALELFQTRYTEPTVRRAATAKDKSLALVMRAVRNPGRGLNDLKRIAALTPNSPYLSLLVTREVNKVEDWVLSKPLTGMTGSLHDANGLSWDDDDYDKKEAYYRKVNLKKDWLYVSSLRAFLQEQSGRSTQNNSTQALWQLAIAHLFYIENKDTAAMAVLQQVNPGTNKKIALQLKIQQTILLARLRDVTEVQVQQQLFDNLTFIRKNAALLALPASQLSRIYYALSHAFFDRHDIAVSGLLYRRAMGVGAGLQEYRSSVFYASMASVADIDRLVTLIVKKDKTPFERFICADFTPIELTDNIHYMDVTENEDRESITPGLDVLYNLKGKLAMRDGDLGIAAAAFHKVSPAFWDDYKDTYARDYFGSPDFIAADSLTPQPGNNPYKIVRRMIALEKEAVVNPQKRALNYYLLGNMWYHCSYWGKAVFMLVSNWNQDETDRPHPRATPAYLNDQPDYKRYGAVYYRCSRAATYFSKSLAAHPGPNLAARAFYMLAECDRRDRWMTARVLGNKSNIEEGDIASPLFKTWARRYRNTRAYEECLSHCPELRDYLGK